MKLSDGDIKERLSEQGGLDITPVELKEQLTTEDGQIQPASVDLRLGGELRLFEDGRVLDVKGDTEPTEVRRGEEMILESGEFAIASTRERVSLPSDLAAEVKGRSSIGRLGLHIHTAGWIDPGFSGQITLEIVNHSPNSVKLYEDMRVCQIVFDVLSSPCNVEYGEKESAKYHGQTGPTGSRISKDFSDEEK